MPETQAQSFWTAPTGTLGALVASATARARELHLGELVLRRRAEAAPRAPSLREALLGGTVGVIAEIKRSSPSRGAINPGLDGVAQARAYVTGRAAAISVLTEPERFGGSIGDLREVARAVAVPVLRKDFLVAAVQLYEARANGASAALLIARALEPERLCDLVATAHGIGLEAVVEIRDEDELNVALDAGAKIVGVNNRNLETLIIDPSTAARMIPQIPLAVVAIAESGMSTRTEIEAAARLGADAVLVGSALSAAADPAGAVAGLAGVRAARYGRTGERRIGASSD